MSEPTQEEVISTVTSIFKVNNITNSPESLNFKIEDDDFKSKFVYLAQRLEKRDLICRIKKSVDGTYILVNRFPPQKQGWLSKSWMPRVLFGIVVAFVMVDGYYRTLSANSIVHIGEPFDMAVLYTFSLLGILGIHEAGHLVAAKIHKIRTTWPYFIPGIPVIGIPTFGAFIQSRGLTVNRDILFDVAIAGPLAGLAVAIIVSIFGAYTSPVIDAQQADELFGKSELVKMQDNILMSLALAMFGKNGSDTEVIMSPILFAAWLGFLITFLNLLPAWQLDGGHIARVMFGEKWHRIATYASMGVLVYLGYWVMAMLILLLSSRSPGATPLDDISPLSKNRKRLYVVVAVLAFLCAPLPFPILF